MTADRLWMSDGLVRATTLVLKATRAQAMRLPVGTRRIAAMEVDALERQLAMAERRLSELLPIAKEVGALGLQVQTLLKAKNLFDVEQTGSRPI